MKPQTHNYLTSQHLEHKLLQKELELIAEDNDFLLNLLASLQTEHIVTHKYDEKTNLFFNHFQYFFHQTKHLINGIATIEKQESIQEPKINYTYLKDEIDCLIQKYGVFKDNFKRFLSSLSAPKPQYTYYAS
jgi:site-specific recombinase